MSNIIAYFIEVNIFICLFYIFYRYYLNNETDIRWNRYYFIITIPTSLILPLIELSFNAGILSISPTLVDVINGFVAESNMVVLFGNHTFSVSNFTDNQVNTQLIIAPIIIIYLLGLIFHSYRFIKDILKLRRIKLNAIKTDDPCIYIHSKENLPTFSFVNSIFLSHDFIKLPQKSRDQILVHEKIHVNQKHSIDILAIEIIKIIFWVNPLINKFLYWINEIHEYLADNKANKLYADSSYPQLILELAVKGQKIAHVANFSKSQVKNRIKMLLSKEPDNLRRFKFYLAIPLLIIFTAFLLSAKCLIENELRINSELSFASPLKSNFVVTCNYFENKKITIPASGNAIQQLTVSHKKISFSTSKNNPVFAVEDGYVSSIKTIDNWGINEIEIEILHNDNYKSVYSGLWKANVGMSTKVVKNQVIAYTGDSIFYQNLSFSIFKNGFPENPEIYINFK